MASSPSPPAALLTGGQPSAADQKWSLTGSDLGRLILPYLKVADATGRKISCTVCGMKFANLVKGLNHIENKHMDCLQYKCSLCKSIKNSRLAFDCHVRSRHTVGNDSRDRPCITPLFRLKRPFSIKAERATKSKGGRLHQQQQNQQQNHSQRSSSYDLQFVTFLRSELASDAEVGGGEEAGLATVSSWHWATPSQGPAHLAEWLHKEQGIFRINRRQEFAKKWYQLKVIYGTMLIHIVSLWLYPVFEILEFSSNCFS